MSIPEQRDEKAARAERARRQRIKRRIRRDAEMRRAGLGDTPTLREIYAPKVIFAAIVLLTIIGAVLIRRVEYRFRHSPERRIPHLTAVKSLDALAVALGRYKFHTGRYPTAAQGLPALNKDFGEEGWDGPYLVQLFDDPWGHDYVYAPPSAPDGLPELFSCGPDGLPHTRDDLFPGTNYFNVGEAWTNGWLHRQERLPEITLGD